RVPWVLRPGANLHVPQLSCRRIDELTLSPVILLRASTGSYYHRVARRIGVGDVSCNNRRPNVDVSTVIEAEPAHVSSIDRYVLTGNRRTSRNMEPAGGACSRI